ncbi:MAG: alpha/beta hydrolase [Myxococcota bacterium]
MNRIVVKSSNRMIRSVALLTALAGCGEPQDEPMPGAPQDAPADPQEDQEDTESGEGTEQEPSIPVERIELSLGDLVFQARAAGPEGGELVVLLHGFPTTSYAFEPQLRALGSAGYRAVAPDLRGYSPGARPDEVQDYALVELAGDVVAMADELCADRFHLVGHDWGAAIGWLVSGFFGDRVSSFTAISIPHPAAFQRAMLDPATGQLQASQYASFLRSEGAAARLLAEDAALLRALYGQDGAEDVVEVFGDVDLSGPGRLPDAHVAEYLDIVGDASTLDRALHYYRANWGGLEDPETSLDGLVVQSPTLYIWGDRDFSVTRAAAEGSADFVVGSSYELLVRPGAGHWIPELDADWLTDVISAHIEDHAER